MAPNSYYTNSSIHKIELNCIYLKFNILQSLQCQIKDKSHTVLANNLCTIFQWGIFFSDTIFSVRHFFSVTPSVTSEHESQFQTSEYAIDGHWHAECWHVECS